MTCYVWCAVLNDDDDSSVARCKLLMLTEVLFFLLPAKRTRSCIHGCDGDAECVACNGMMEPSGSVSRHPDSPEKSTESPVKKDSEEDFSPVFRDAVGGAPSSVSSPPRRCGQRSKSLSESPTKKQHGGVRFADCYGLDLESFREPSSDDLEAVAASAVAAAAAGVGATAATGSVAQDADIDDPMAPGWVPSWSRQRRASSGSSPGSRRPEQPLPSCLKSPTREPPLSRERSGPGLMPPLTPPETPEEAAVAGKPLSMGGRVLQCCVSSPTEFTLYIQHHKLGLESLHFSDRERQIKGVLRVCNVSYHKKVKRFKKLTRKSL